MEIYGNQSFVKKEKIFFWRKEKIKSLFDYVFDRRNKPFFKKSEKIKNIEPKKF
jgi:hypothetical protein